MGKYSEELMNKKIISPDNEINIIDEEYVSKVPTIYSINLKEDTTFIISDSNGKICYKFTYKSISDTITICDAKDKPLITIKKGLSSVKILAEEGKKEFAKLKFKNSTKGHKFLMEYINKATEKEEVLNLNCSSNYRTSGVFYGREKENAPMISRICRLSNDINLNKKFNYTIEIAPNVDNLIIIALSVYISMKRYQDFVTTAAFI